MRRLFCLILDWFGWIVDAMMFAFCLLHCMVLFSSMCLGWFFLGQVCTLDIP